jgi:ubiquitin C-terminal hydrolase
MIEKLYDYRCDGCGDNTSTKYRKQLFNYAPEILSLQLKITDAYGDKLNIRVTIDPLLDLNPYRDNGMKDQILYELTAVIKHSGNDSRSGHYIALVKGPDGAWSQYNDSRMTTSTLATAVSSKGGFTPYILFYHRKE